MSSPSRSPGPSRQRPAVVRLSGRDRWGRLRLSGRHLWERGLEAAPLWTVLLLLAGTACLVPTGTFLAPRVEVGAIVARDYLATRELLLPDRETTEAKRLRARDEVLPVYDLDDTLAAERDRRLADLFAFGRELAGAAPRRAVDDEELAAALGEASGLEVEPGMAAALARRAFAPELEERLRGVVADKTELLAHRTRGVTVRRLASGAEAVQLDLYDVLAYPGEGRELAARELRDSGLGAGERGRLADLAVRAATPNLLPNRSETLARQERAAAGTAMVFTQVRKGQIIVRKGDEITAAAAETIASLAGRKSWPDRLLPLAGSALLLALAAGALWLGLAGQRAAGKSRVRLYSEGALLLLVAVLGTRFGLFLAGASSGAFEAAPLNAFHSYVYAVPVASLALVAALLYGRWAALLLAVVFSVLAGRLAAAEGLWPALYTVAGSLAALFAIDPAQFRQRSVLARAGLKIGLVNLVVIVALAASSQERTAGFGHLAFDLACGAAGGILCAAVASFAIPVCESLLSITTDIKLVELANTNLPLLRRLALEAPGTFQHSLMVASLTKTGCEAIGADAILAYTAALYHDIGKIGRADYFIENQRAGANPHDSLSPAMSTLVLISHIKDGAELARRHGLPRPLVDAIEQHHGTRTITYFYNRACERATAGEEVAKEAYRYPGPRPQDRVMGVLMLADAVEAASRTLLDAIPARIEAMIAKIFDACLEEGQLDETDLTLGDLRRVAEAFLRLLANLYHRRIDYPGFEFNRDTTPGSAGERQASVS